MNLNVTIADILHIAATAVRTKPAITAQSVPVYTVRPNLETNNVSQTSNNIDVKSQL